MTKFWGNQGIWGCGGGYTYSNGKTGWIRAFKLAEFSRKEKRK